MEKNTKTCLKVVLTEGYTLYIIYNIYIYIVTVEDKKSFEFRSVERPSHDKKTGKKRYAVY